MSAFRNRTQARRRAQLKLSAIAQRGKATRSEQLLWAELRAGKLGVRFRRQVPLGANYIADFVAPAVKLVVEVDGEWHARRPGADARRDRQLRRLGYRVLRLDAEVVVHQLPVAVGLIREAVAGLQAPR